MHPSDGPFRPTLHAFTLHWNLSTSATQIPSLGSDDYFSFVSFTDIKGLMLDRSFCYGKFLIVLNFLLLYMLIYYVIFFFICKSKCIDLIGRIVRVGNFEDGEPINNVWNQIYVELEDES